jgi:hypothetical protein
MSCYGCRKHACLSFANAINWSGMDILMDIPRNVPLFAKSKDGGGYGRRDV